jgi:lysophospholipase L1-like esterase
MRRTTIAAAAAALLVSAAAVCAQPWMLEDFSDADAIEARRGFNVLRDAEFAITDGIATFHNPAGAGATVLIPVDQEILADNETWDDCNGLSFMLRGDGSEHWSRIGFGNGSHIYELYFPLANDQWHEVRVHFDELVGVGPLYPIKSFGALPPSGIRTVQLGDRWRLTWNNAPMPEHSFAIDDVKLIADAPEPLPAPSPRPLEEVLQKLRDREPVSIQCMGDSITAGTGLPDRDTQRYAVRLGEKLRERLGYDEIECYSRAVGGARSPHARHWIPRDFHGVEPDLVTMAIGYNDKSGAYHPQYYAWAMNDYIDRVARITGGTAAVCPIATLPGGSHRFVMMDDYAQTVRDLADRRGDITCIDLAAQIQQLGRQGWMEYLGDLAHPNIEGHEWIADALADWIVERVEAER